MAYIDLNHAIVPSLLPQTAPVTVTGWSSNWVIGALLGAGLLLGWVGLGFGKKKAAARRARKVRITKGRKKKR